MARGDWLQRYVITMAKLVAVPNRRGCAWEMLKGAADSLKGAGGSVMGGAKSAGGMIWGGKKDDEAGDKK